MLTVAALQTTGIGARVLTSGVALGPRLAVSVGDATTTPVWDLGPDDCPSDRTRIHRNRERVRALCPLFLLAGGASDPAPKKRGIDRSRQRARKTGCFRLHLVYRIRPMLKPMGLHDIQASPSTPPTTEAGRAPGSVHAHRPSAMGPAPDRGSRGRSSRSGANAFYGRKTRVAERRRAAGPISRRAMTGSSCT